MIPIRFIVLLCSVLAMSSCRPKQEQVPTADTPKLSLGQWTYHTALFAGEMSTLDFIDRAHELGFQGVDFVNQFFKDKASDRPFLDSLVARLNAKSIQPVMIMVDGEGDLGSTDSTARILAVQQHLQWIDAASYVKAPYVRVNAHGDGTPTTMKSACVQSLRELNAYAQSRKVTILVENHGSYSSDGDWMEDLLRQLAGSGIYALADFDNWCIERENGKLWGAPCIKRYDALKGMKQLLPYAKGLSVKSFTFDSHGEETTIDYAGLISAAKESGFSGYYGIEYEGEEHSPDEGVKLTLALVNKYY